MFLDMPEPRARELDPLEGGPPRPTTVTQRRVIAAVGALAIALAAGILVLALGRGATPVSAADELGAARPAKRPPAGAPASARE